MRIAITGGIGSGKSHVCGILEKHGIKVYDCDAAAKRLMNQDRKLQQELAHLVGPEVCADGQLNKAMLATFLLQSETNKQAINNIVHPAVAHDFMQSGYTWLESAILYESGFDRRIDFGCSVCVSAPRELRITRVMKRDGISRAKALKWIEAQMPQQEVEQRSNYIIYNDELQDLNKQIIELIKYINKK